MKKWTTMILSTLALLSPALAWANADNGLVQVQSQHSVQETSDKLVKALNSKGMTVFAQVDHAAGAKKVDIELRPTQVIIFGNPKVGSPLMVCQQSVAIDLPQKALISEDESGNVWLTYNDPKYLASRHQIQGCDEVLNKVSNALANFAKAATQ
ncbi:DUF302 domain-containing protein [Vibrio sp. CK2-1]|uniref:DUF302 domain-containing protein n=1 Tax=Vibrio sp. CK2-1 TaxID=2912249 RepID=UPI001F34B7DA|nr:DUF302 domain-containing protein [Vibrio sp. CK2-1]MCF7353239.1 DUF302 domain-containing protein [Vibrio sp. CK2-1]